MGLEPGLVHGRVVLAGLVGICLRIGRDAGARRRDGGGAVPSPFVVVLAGVALGLGLGLAPGLYRFLMRVDALARLLGGRVDRARFVHRVIDDIMRPGRHFLRPVLDDHDHLDEADALSFEGFAIFFFQYPLLHVADAIPVRGRLAQELRLRVAALARSAGDAANRRVGVAEGRRTPGGGREGH